MNEKKFIKKDGQAYFPDFDKFMEIVKSARTALDDHPPKIEAGQIWGITDKDYRFIVLTSPEKSLTGKDIRVVPVTREKGLASVEDVIIPDGAVYRASSVMMPFQVTNISTDRLDLFFGTVEQPIVDFLQETVRSGKLAQLPDGTYSGEADVFDPVIMKFNSDLKSELLAYAEEVFVMIEHLAVVSEVNPVVNIIEGILTRLRNALDGMVAQPQYMYNLMAAPGNFNFDNMKRAVKLLVDDGPDLIINFVIQSRSVALEFQSRKFRDSRSIGNIIIESTSESDALKYSFNDTYQFKNIAVKLDLPTGIVESILRLKELKLSFRFDDQDFEYILRF